MQGSTSASDDDGSKATDRPRYQIESELRRAYEEAGSILAASRRFDASYFTVRNWLIEYGIHEPQSREEVREHSTKLEDLDDLPALSERRTEGSA
jgi:hypothetical protein